MKRHCSTLLAPLALLVAPASAERYIAVFDETVTTQTEVDAALAQVENHGVTLLHRYYRALQGCTFEGTPAQRAAIEANVIGLDYVEDDAPTELFGGGQTIPEGVRRISAHLSDAADIDGVDERVDVDIAILDSGIWLQQDIDDGGDANHPVYTTGVPVSASQRHEDLNVVRWVNKSLFLHRNNDFSSHGTHVAGTAAALDNGIGVVGVAPGARLWAVKVIDVLGFVGDLIAGLEYVAVNATEIEVCNLSLGARGQFRSLHGTIQYCTNEGVIVVAAAGNAGIDVYGEDGILFTDDDVVPAAYPEVCTVSAMADTDGQRGGSGSAGVCGSAQDDDAFASFSNFSRSVVAQTKALSRGAAIDLAAPGVHVLSTVADDAYASWCGTSMAAPHVTGAMALLTVSSGSPFNARGVASARRALIDRAEEQVYWRAGESALDRDARHERLVYANLPLIHQRAVCDVVEMSVGNGHVLALASDGAGRSWGRNSFGELGNGTTLDQAVAGPVTRPSGALHDDAYRAFAAGQGWFSLGLLSDGTVWAFGNDSRSQLGSGSADGLPHALPEPVDPAGLSALYCSGDPRCKGAMAVAAGFWHGLALKHDGTVHAWGGGARGALGNGGTSDAPLPVPVAGLTNIIDIAAGSQSSYALQSDGTLWGWGANDDGQLGDGTSIDRTTPVMTQCPAGMPPILDVVAGKRHALALCADGSVWAWGQSFHGQLGGGSIGGGPQRTPVPVVGLPAPAMAIGAGFNHSLACLAGGSAWAWGWNQDSQLGDGTTNDSGVPLQLAGGPSDAVVLVAGSMNYESGAGDSSHLVARVLALPPDQRVPAGASTWSVGDNVHGQLGDRTNTDSLVLVRSFDGCPRCESCRSTCDAGVNSVGLQARIGAAAETSLAANYFALHVVDAPPSVFGLFYFGDFPIQVPFGEGFRCVGGAIQRLFPIARTDALGRATQYLDLSSPVLANSVVPGTEKYFQFWYRDTMGGPFGFNLTDGLGVTFQP